MKLILQNFRSYDFFEIEFGDISEITGRTGGGKTSLLEAIVFAIYGRDFYGSTGTDRYIKVGKDEAVVVLTLDTVEIKRILTLKGQEIYLNGSKAVQGEVELKYGNIENVLPVINPFYFMGLNDSEKRQLFMKLLPQQDRKKIFIEKYGEKLAAKFLLMSPTGAKNQLKTMQDTVSNNQVMIGQFREQLKTDKQEVGILEGMLKPVSEDNVAAIAHKEDLIHTSRVLTENLMVYGDLPGRKKEAERGLEEVVNKVKSILTTVGGSSLKEALESHGDLLNKLEAKEREVNDRMMVSNGLLKQNDQLVESGECPVCKQKIDGALFGQHSVEILESIDKNADLWGKIKVQITKEKDVVGQLTELANQGKALQEELRKITMVWDKYVEISKQRQANNEEIDRLEDVIADPAIMNNRETQAQIKVIQSRIEKAEKDIARLESQNTSLEPEIADTEVIVEAFGSKGVESEIIKLQTQELVKVVEKYIKGIDIVTVRDNKSNEGYKEVFDISVDGVGFKSLSFGEKIKVSTAFGFAVRELQPEFRLPFVLIDEASVMSKMPIGEIIKWCKKANVALVYTKISDGNFAVKDIKDGK